MKGQLSLDLLIAIVMTLILIQALSAFGDNFLFNQEKTSLKLQAKHILSDLEKSLKYAYTLEENDDYTIRYTIPWLNLSSSQGEGAPALAGCVISATARANITLTIDESNYPGLKKTCDPDCEVITESIPYPIGVHSFNATCGSTFEIKKQGS